MFLVVPWLYRFYPTCANQSTVASVFSLAQFLLVSLLTAGSPTSPPSLLWPPSLPSRRSVQRHRHVKQPTPYARTALSSLSPWFYSAKIYIFLKTINRLIWDKELVHNLFISIKTNRQTDLALRWTKTLINFCNFYQYVIIIIIWTL